MYLFMAAASIVAGALSTMNVWVDDIRHIRYSLNDVYMIALMTGWMLFFMALWEGDKMPMAVSAAIIVAAIAAIRGQWWVTPTQYIQGMIPHHSMAIHMSRKLTDRYPKAIPEIARTIISGQQREIEYMLEAQKRKDPSLSAA